MPNSSTLSQREAKAIGAYIRFLRKKKGLTQEQVSEGICSVTYLSKIETGKVVPNHEMVDHLYERLGVSTNSDLKLDYGYLRLTLHECRLAFDNVNYDKAQELYDELKEFEDYFQHEPEFFHQFLILTFYNHLVNNQMDEAEDLYNELSAVVAHLNQEKQLQFYHYAGVYFGIKQDFNRSLEVLLKAEQSMEYLQKKNPHLMLHLALTYSNLKNPVMASYYANQALSIFDSDLLYLKSIDCKMIIGIGYTRSGNYHAAEKTFMNIIKLGDSLKFNSTRSLALHNLAYNYGKMGDFERAKQAYLRSLSFRDDNDPKISDTILFLVEILTEDNELEEALSHLSRLKDQEWVTEKLRLKVKLAHLKIQKKKNNDARSEEAYIDFLQNIFVPHFETSDEREILNKKYEELGMYFHKNRKYKLSSQYLLKRLEL